MRTRERGRAVSSVELTGSSVFHCCREEHRHLPVQAFKARLAHVQAKEGELYMFGVCQV